MPGNNLLRAAQSRQIHPRIPLQQQLQMRRNLSHLQSRQLLPTQERRQQAPDLTSTQDHAMTR
jgi:hypothetical protein